MSKTIELSGRYTVGTTICLRAVGSECEWEQVLKSERRGMTPEQLGGLTVAKVTSVRRASNDRQILAEESEGSVGLGEVSVCEVIA